jgi:hypothetical protein
LAAGLSTNYEKGAARPAHWLGRYRIQSLPIGNISALAHIAKNKIYFGRENILQTMIANAIKAAISMMYLAVCMALPSQSIARW